MPIKKTKETTTPTIKQEIAKIAELQERLLPALLGRVPAELDERLTRLAQLRCMLRAYDHLDAVRADLIVGSLKIEQQAQQGD